MSNALVAGPVDTATPFSGAGLLDSGTQLASAIESGNWVEGGLAAFSTVVDTVATAIDPLGSLIAAGLGWLIDHFEPIKGWFNDLTGDAGAVAGFSQTWTNVQNQLNSSADYLDRVVSDLDDMAGEAIDAYRRFQTDAAAHIRASGQWAGAMATGLQIASTIVQVVHDLVRDILSQLVGSAISWATEAVVTVGIATPWIISQVSSRVASWTAKISGKLTGLLRSCGKLGDLLNELRALMEEGARALKRVLRREPKTSEHSSSASRPSGDQDAPARPEQPHETGTSISGTPTPEAPTSLSAPAYDLSDPAQVRRASVHNPDAPTAMLGSWDAIHPELSYTTRAEAGGHAYFSLDTWDEVKRVQGIDDAGMFDRYNISFLEDQAAARKSFHFSHLPTRKDSALQHEIDWLVAHGYVLDRNSMTAHYVGE